MTITRSDPEPPGDSPVGGSGSRTATQQIARFGDPVTRMLLASDGFTQPRLEAILGTDLQVRVLRQDEIAAEQLPATVADALRLDGPDRVIVRRSCLINADMVTASVNYVVAVSGPAAAAGADDVHVPIGRGLVSRGVSQRRHVLRAGVTRWPDGRLCAAKAYVIMLGDHRPLCYIREIFNPSVVPPEHTPISDEDLSWADEPEYPRSLPAAPVRRGGCDTESPRTGGQCSRALPDLIHPRECDSLAADLAAAARGRAFAIHLGARASAALDLATLPARRALAIGAAAVLNHGLNMPIVTIGELRYNGESCGAPANSVASAEDRAYSHAATQVENWRVANPPIALCAQMLRGAAERYPASVVRDLLVEVAAMLPIAASAPAASRELYSSIAPLHISRAVRSCESNTTRPQRTRHEWDRSTQLLWIGDRNHEFAPQHLSFAALVRNPLAVTLGPTATPDDVEFLCRYLNPARRPGRLTLIPALSGTRTAAALPALFEAAARCGTPVSWMCDPMHADDPAAAIHTYLSACRSTGTAPAGLHLDCEPRSRLDTRLDTGRALHCVITTLSAMWAR
ncbi:3-deoxy-7-phosphoheptulonate synthase [Nocardia anaemiae]|uniref:3-deoxy-7-phosphoheptulonate synthase n=1 Tax=Nocardia anaemiae TaxID=263910 RepID=UPI0007A4F007|nr:3-deoxy-7-phosphoheptulonate synthase [Nocardia anaemiae]